MPSPLNPPLIHRSVESVGGLSFLPESVISGVVPQARDVSFLDSPFGVLEINMFASLQSNPFPRFLSRHVQLTARDPLTVTVSWSCWRVIYLFFSLLY